MSDGISITFVTEMISFIGLGYQRQSLDGERSVVKDRNVEFERSGGGVKKAG